MSEDSYWFRDDKQEEPRMVALCAECGKKMKLGSFWAASNGYGNYDLNCHECGKVIHKRTPDE